jgi:hypothetical protein
MSGNYKLVCRMRRTKGAGAEEDDTYNAAGEIKEGLEEGKGKQTTL